MSKLLALLLALDIAFSSPAVFDRFQLAAAEALGTTEALCSFFGGNTFIVNPLACFAPHFLTCCTHGAVQYVEFFLNWIQREHIRQKTR